MMARTSPHREAASRIAPTPGWEHPTITASPFAVSAEVMAYLVELYGLAVKAGRLPQAGSNEMVISEALAQNRDIQLGDMIGDPAHPAYPGFKLLAPQGMVKIGPFLSSTYLMSALKGLAMYVPNFTITYISHFNVKQLCLGLPREKLKPFLDADVDFLDKVRAWCANYFPSVDLSRLDTSEIRELLDQ